MHPKGARIVNLKLIFKELTDSSYPGFVQAEFTESDGTKRRLFDKWPIFSSDDLPPAEAFPLPGKLECELLGAEIDASGRKIFKINTQFPHSVEDPEGEIIFEVLSDQIEDINL